MFKRIGAAKSEIEEELFSCKNLAFVEKQEKDNKIRYALFFVYSNKKGRAYVLSFEDKIVVITIFPLGKRTLKKYRKKRFI